MGIVGESGCGKSTLARLILGLIEADSGEIHMEQQAVDWSNGRARKRLRRNMQMVFQNPYSSLNPRRKIGSQLADALVALDVVTRRGRAARVRELCELVGLTASAAERYPHEFSGGQRQRIAIARTLAAEPSVLVLDEPLASLDASAQAQLANLLVGLSRDLGLGLLLISHDLAIVRHVADAVSVMYLGVMVEQGATRPLWELPLHPYSEALIGAVPHPDGSGFLPYAFDRCSEEEPPLVALSDGRFAACWLQPAGASPAHPAARAAELAIEPRVE
jgi:peptide/nickel transport system ATP-binding protein